MKNKTIIAMLLILALAVAMFTVVGCQEAAQLVLGNDGIVAVEKNATVSLGVSHTGELKSGQEITYGVIFGAEFVTLEGGSVKGVNEGSALVSVTLDDQKLYVQVNVNDTALDEARKGAVTSVESLGFTTSAQVNALDDEYLNQMKAEYAGMLLFYSQAVESCKSEADIEKTLDMAEAGLNALSQKYEAQAQMIGNIEGTTLAVTDFVLPGTEDVYTALVNEYINVYGLAVKKAAYISEVLSASTAADAIIKYNSFTASVDGLKATVNERLLIKKTQIEYEALVEKLNVAEADYASLWQDYNNAVAGGNYDLIENLKEQVEAQSALLNSLRQAYALVSQQLAGYTTFDGVNIVFASKTVYYNDNKFSCDTNGNLVAMNYQVEPVIQCGAGVACTYTVSVLVGGNWIAVCEDGVWTWDATTTAAICNAGFYNFRLNFTLSGKDDEGNDVTSVGTYDATLTILKATFATPIWPELEYTSYGVYTKLKTINFADGTGLAGEGENLFGTFRWYDDERYIAPINYGYAVELLPLDKYIGNFNIVRQIVRVPTAKIYFSLKVGNGSKDYDGATIDTDTLTWTLLGGYYNTTDRNGNPVKVTISTEAFEESRDLYEAFLKEHESDISFVVGACDNNFHGELNVGNKDGIDYGDYEVTVNPAITSTYFAVDVSECVSGVYTIERVTIREVLVQDSKVYDATADQSDFTLYQLSNNDQYFATFTTLKEITDASGNVVGYEEEDVVLVPQFKLYGPIAKGIVDNIDNDTIFITTTGGRLDYPSKNVGSYVYEADDDTGFISAKITDVNGVDRTANYICNYDNNNANTRLIFNADITPRGVYVTGTVFDREYDGTANVYATGLTQTELDRGQTQVLSILNDDNTLALDDAALGAMLAEKAHIAVDINYNDVSGKNIYVNGKYCGATPTDNGKNAGVNKSVLFENTDTISWTLALDDSINKDVDGTYYNNYEYNGDPAYATDTNNNKKVYYVGSIDKALAKTYIDVTDMLAERVYDASTVVYGGNLISDGSGLIYKVANSLVADDIIDVYYNGAINTNVGAATDKNKTLLYGESVTNVLDNATELQNYIDNKSHSMTVPFDDTVFSLQGDSINYDWTGFEFDGYMFIVQAKLTFSGLEFNQRVYDATNIAYVDLGYGNKGLKGINLTTGEIETAVTIYVEGKATEGLYEDVGGVVNATVVIGMNPDTGKLYNAYFNTKDVAYDEFGAYTNKNAYWQDGQWSITLKTGAVISEEELSNYSIGGADLEAKGMITPYSLSLVEFYMGERLYDRTDVAYIDNVNDLNTASAEWGYIDTATGEWVKLDNIGDVAPGGMTAGYMLNQRQSFKFRTGVNANHYAVRDQFEHIVDTATGDKLPDEIYFVVYQDGIYKNCDAGEKEATYTNYEKFGKDANNYILASNFIVKSWNYINAAPITEVSGFIVNKVQNYQTSDANITLDFVLDNLDGTVNYTIIGLLAGDQLALDTKKLGSCEYLAYDADGNLVSAHTVNVEWDAVANKWKLIDGMDAYIVRFNTVGFSEVYDSLGNIITKRENYDVGGATIFGVGYIYPAGEDLGTMGDDIKAR
ncbi:MAG: hypothetical protein PHX51_03790 [Clostridia bacterium]|nr:hypothetical protein [Clostridia bacterium]